MVLFGFDIFVATARHYLKHAPVPALRVEPETGLLSVEWKRPRLPWFQREQGTTEHDWEGIIGPWYFVASRLSRGDTQPEQ